MTHYNKKYVQRNIIMKAQKEAHGRLRNPRARTHATLTTAIMTTTTLVVGLVVLLAASCAPATIATGTAPDAITDLAVADVDGTSFTVQWSVPTETGTKTDGTILESEEVGYSVYYLAKTTEQESPPSAASIRKDSNAKNQPFRGVSEAKISKVAPSTSYYVTVVSHNLFAKLETASDEVVEATTDVDPTSFVGILSYGEEVRDEFTTGIETTISPVSTPTFPGSDPGSINIRYRLEGVTNVYFSPAPSINTDNGDITVNSTVAGRADYSVQASAPGYTTQYTKLTIVIRDDFVGTLSYDLSDEFFTGFDRTIRPSSIPSVLETYSGNLFIQYSLTKSTGSTFVPEPIINPDDGVITIRATSDTGTATYVVQASIADYYNPQEVTLYNPQEVTLSITLNNIENSVVMNTYYSSASVVLPADRATATLPLALGPAIKDSGEFSLEDDDAILTIAGLASGTMYTIYFGSSESAFAESYQKAATDTGFIVILKSELNTGANSFPFTNGAAIGISGSSFTGTQHIATYFSSNIYNHHDLQAMRNGLYRNYVLQNDINFSTMNDGVVVSNFKTVGTGDNPFRGTLDGMGHSIVGLKINSPEILYQGLFGIVIKNSANAVIAENLVLRDFKIMGGGYSAALVGWMIQGTIQDVRVEVSNVSAGIISANGDHGDDHAGKHAGGLVGFAGRSLRTYGPARTLGAASPRVKILNTSSEIRVFGVDYVGGLVGRIEETFLEDSYATGDVSGNASIGGLVGSSKGYTDSRNTVTGYATGDVTGNRNIGGLVGESDNLSTVAGYATGDVSGRQGSVGGLVGYSSGLVTGYATGSVRGNTTSLYNEASEGTGGLVGSLWGSATAVGYATGDVSGERNVGGLVGLSLSSVAGYATGNVTGDADVGGLVGYISRIARGHATGYARNIVRRRGGGALTFGKVIGRKVGDVTLKIYHSDDSSAFEGQIYDGVVGTNVVDGTTGEGGTAVTVDMSTMQDVFALFTFDDSVRGSWTWLEDGKWPAINIGEIKLAADQPVDRQ